MRDGAPGPEKVLIAAVVGLVLLLLAQWLLAQPLPADAPFDADAALARSRAAVGGTLGNHVLTGADGAPIELQRLRGKPLVVTFVYTGCFAVCPAATAALARAVAAARATLGADAFDVVTVGFNLPYDTPAAMREFARKQGIDDPRWHFVTADAATRDALAADVGFAWKPVAGGFDHVTQATLIDADGRVARQLYGDSLEPQRLAVPLAQLVARQRLARADGLAGWLERVRVLCTVYDPRAGRYRLDYGLFIEIFAGLSIVAATLGYLIAGARKRRAGTPPAAHA